MKRGSQAIRSWRAGPLIWRPGTHGRRLDLRSGPRRSVGALWRGVLASRRGRLSILAIVAACLVLGGGWLWFRDSPLVSVNQVTIRGTSGPDAGAIRSALTASARSMTTLDVQTGRLYAAVSAYPAVQALRVTTQFPHGMRIRVIEHLAVAQVVVGGRRIAVAPDGTLLHDRTAPASLPVINLTVLPGGTRLVDPRALESLAAARTAPGLLRSRIQTISVLRGHGLAARLQNGPIVYLGDAGRLRAKWASVVAVLADPSSVGAAYIDVTDPGRPAAGMSVSSASGGSGGSTGVSPGG